MREIVCVSLFNGMGGAFMALEMSGFNVVQKISSEVDKYAMKANDAMFPDTIQLGDVSKIEVLKVDGKSVGLKNDKGIEIFFKEGIEIIVCGGSPCQSFSFSGKRKGMATKDEQEILTLDHYLKLKSEDYEFEGQSYLFWEFVRLRDEINPNYWFLENVEMGEKWEKVLSKAVGVNGIHVNSALLSAQNRKRIYWFNFGMKPMGLFGELGSIVEQPKDKGILLKHILEEEVDEKYFLSEKMLSWLERHGEKRGVDPKYLDGSTKACTITATATANMKQNLSTDYIIHTASNKDNLIMQLNPSKESGGKQPYQQNRVYDVDGISPALCAFKSDLIISLKSKDKRLKKMIENSDLVDGEVAHLDTYNQTLDREKSPALKLPHNDRFLYATSRIRRLTPTESMRLQTIPEDHINTMLNCGVSDSQLYKMIGNGWTIQVISYLFNYIHK
jgi:DNA-cytosine methyltransferase